MKIIEEVIAQIAAVQAEIGIAVAGLQQIKEAAENLGKNSKKIIELCDQFKTES